MKSALLLIGGALASTQQFSDTPVTRIVSLLRDLSSQLEADAKTEEKLFTKYKCWYKQVTAEKTQANKEAEERIATLTNYIDDIKNGRIEFTDERVRLEKEVADINETLETAKNQRKKENDTYKINDENNQAAITALDSVVAELGAKAPAGSFLAHRFEVRKSLEMIRAHISSSEFRFIAEHLYEQDPKKRDWDKLNQKADFKDTYGARSGKIQSTLNKLLNMFKQNKDDADKQESDAKDAYEKLKTSKEAELAEAQQALIDMKEESGARGLSLAEAEEEKESLETQVTNDTKYLGEVQDAFDAKLGEYKMRKETRVAEIASISEAIQFLASDESRDTFSSSFKSQGYFFIQESQKSNKNLSKALSTKSSEQRKST
jgi:hypothetical protein